MKALQYTLLCAVFALSPALYAADVFVSNYEALQRLSVVADASNEPYTSQKPNGMRPVSLTFEALGRAFELQLEPNERVIDAMPGGALAEGIRAYRGTLIDNPESWVRIVVFNGMPRGLIWDGEQMLAIEAPGDSAMDITSPVIFRLSDLFIAPGTMACGAKSLPSNAAQAYATMKTELGTVALSQAPGAVSEITLSVIGDYEFTTAQGGDTAAEAAITARFNNIDGYFSEQVGVQLNVQLIETHSDSNDPFGDTLDSGALLDELSEYRLQSPQHNNTGLTHLYTGRNFSTSTVGVAWRGALCDDYFSAGLSEGRAGATTDSLIAAHEIGHNFNAEHDGQPGSSCEDEPEIYIMAASVNGNDEFSACSIGVMQAEAAAASCVTALPTVDVGISESSQLSTVLLGAATDIEFDIESVGTLTASNVVADFTLPAFLSLDSVATSAGSCSNGAGTVSCSLGNLAGLSSHTITISTTPVDVGVGTVNATVTTSDNDERMINNQESLTVTVNPAVDLAVNSLSTSPVFVNESATISATIENVSALDATNVILSISLDAGLQAESASWSIGSCTVTAQQIDCQASSFRAQSSSSLSVTAMAVSTGSHDVTASLSASLADANPGDNSATGTVRVVTPNSEGDDDEGGGTTGPLFLILIAVAGWMSRRRRAIS